MYVKYYCTYCDKEFPDKLACLVHEKIEHIGYTKDVAEIISCGYQPCDYCANQYMVYGCEADCQYKSECMAKHKWAKFKYSEGRDERA